MLQIANQTPLATALGLFTDKRGATIAAVVAKGTFAIREPDVISLLPAQEAVQCGDVHHGDPAASSVKYPSDLVMNKVATDVGIVGEAHSPGGRPVRELGVSVQVGPLVKDLSLVGDRVWERRGASYRASAPEPFLAMPLRYERSFGGAAVGDPQKRYCQANPVGLGYAIGAEGAHGARLPNIEDPAHLIRTPGDRPPVAGFGFIAPSWEPRRGYAGTYDDAWQHDVFPLLPADFDDRFFSCAGRGLSTDGFLQGGELVRLTNLSPAGNIAFRLPAIALRFDFEFRGQLVGRNPAVWTVIIEPDADRCMVVWGCSFDVGVRPSQLAAVSVSSSWLDPKRPQRVER